MAYGLRRLGHFLVSIVVLVTASFLMVHLIPGDPARASAGANAPVEMVEMRRQQLGLDEPLIVQYIRFWEGLFTGNLGESIALRVPVVDVISNRLPATLELAGLAVIAVLVLAVPTGLIAGALTRGGRRRGLEFMYTSTAGVLAVIPEFLLGVVLVYFFAVSTNLLPVAGRDGIQSYILPVAALAIGGAAALSRVVRAETLTVLKNDYIRTARSKRMRAWRLYFKHALPNLMTSTLTIAGLLLGSLIAGTVLVENIFAWPGLGMTIVDAIQGKDYPLVQVIVIIYGSMILLINLIVDILLMIIDPRSTLRED